MSKLPKPTDPQVIKELPRVRIRLIFTVVSGKTPGHTRWIDLMAVEELLKDDLALFLSLFIRAQKEIWKFARWDVRLRTKEVWIMEGDRMVRQLRFPFDMLTDTILTELELQEVPKGTTWPQ